MRELCRKTRFASCPSLVCAPRWRPFPPRLAAASSVTQFSLANGMEIVVIPDHRTAVVTPTWSGIAPEPADDRWASPASRISSNI